MQSNLIYAELLKKVKNYSDNELKNISLKYLYLKFNLSSSDLLINKIQILNAIYSTITGD